MKNKPHKIAITLVIGFLCVQFFFPSLSSLFFSEIQALQNLEQKVDADIGLALPEKKDASLSQETINPRFEAVESVISGQAEEIVKASFHSDQPLTKLMITFPKEAVILEEELPALLSVEEFTEENEWQLVYEEPTKVFHLPIVFEREGNYQASIGDQSIKFEIKPAEKVEVDGETSDSEVYEEASETEALAAEDTLENVSQEKESTDVSQLVPPVTPLDEINHRDVTNWQEFMIAIGDRTVNYINILNDFESADNPTAGIQGVTGSTSNPNANVAYVWFTASTISRTLVIQGNDYQIDFRAVAVGFQNSTFNNESPWDITYQNIDIVHGNWYGFMNFTDMFVEHQLRQNMRYHNVTNVGNQLIHSLSTPITISGNLSSLQTPTYTSRLGRVQTINATNQCNMEVTQVDILDGATVELSTINAGNILLYYSTGQFRVGDDVRLTMTSAGNSGEAYGANIFIQNGNLLVGNNSEVVFNARANSPAISLNSTGARFEIGEDSTVKINGNGRTSSWAGASYNIIYMGGGSSLLVGNRSALKIDAINQGNQTPAVIHVAGTASFVVGKEGILDIKSDSTNAAHSLMNFTNANSTFTFADAQRINLEKTRAVTTATSGLINISGSTGLLDVDIQAINQWRLGNLEEEPDFYWTPVFNLQVNFSGTASTIRNVSSISQSIVDDFRGNFSTRAQRLLFEYIPDVEVSLEPLSENPALENSRIIRGKATPYSMVHLDGDPAIPQPLIESPSISEDRYFHVQADANGDFLVELAEGDYLTKNNIVTAYAYLNGKYDTDETIVQEMGVVAPVDPIAPDIDVIPENMPEIEEEQGLISIDFVSQYVFGDVSISAGTTTYAAQPQRLLDSEGNYLGEERPNYVQISDRRAISTGWTLAATMVEGGFQNSLGEELKGARILLENAMMVTNSLNQSEAPSYRENIKIEAGITATIASATNNLGTGTWVQRYGNMDTMRESVKLEVPIGADPKATNYQATIQWELRFVP